MKSSFFQFSLKKLNYVIHYKPSIYIYIYVQNAILVSSLIMMIIKITVKWKIRMDWEATDLKKFMLYCYWCEITLFQEDSMDNSRVHIHDKSV